MRVATTLYLISALLSIVIMYFFFLTADFSETTREFAAWYSVAKWLLLQQFVCVGLGIFNCFFLLQVIIDIKARIRLRGWRAAYAASSAERAACTLAVSGQLSCRRAAARTRIAGQLPMESVDLLAPVV
jgi:hypothetical protein